MRDQLTVRIPAELSRALKAASRKSGRRNSEIVRLALSDYLQVSKTSGVRPAELVRGLLGSLDSGIPDLAEKHRAYILETLRNGR